MFTHVAFQNEEQVVETLSETNNSMVKFTWKVKEFSKRKDRMYSDPCFTVGDTRFRVLLYPHGNTLDYLSIFVDCPDATEAVDSRWQRPANMAISVVGQERYPGDPAPAETVRRELSHTFQAKSNDWGLNHFMLLKDLHSKDKSYLVNDTLVIEVILELIKETPSSLSSMYDSRSETGMVGLKNQGATCYMNSLLQTLYHTREFRRGVYMMHREETVDDGRDARDDGDAGGKGNRGGLASSFGSHGESNDGKQPVKSIPYALQKVFYKLEHDVNAVPTKELTKSFGWESDESFTQHDVQELNRVLCDNLEEKMKGTPAEGLMAKLYQGEQTMFIESTLNPLVRSTRDEHFYDLQLNVKGCTDIYESFEKYVEVEMMDGDNKWKVEDNKVKEYNGLHEARKGIRFKRFPPVLTLQLKRFEYDPYRGDMVKVNDKYEFPEVLDLDRYLDPETSAQNGGVKNVFRLFAVLVHSGEAHGGHYYAYIRPDLTVDNSPFYKFDDDRVTRVETSQAVAESFGGEAEHVYQMLGQTKKTTYKRAANAYMLVYMRQNEIPLIQRPVVEDDVPQALRVKFEEDARREEARRKEKEDAHLFLRVKAASMREIAASRESFDLVNFETDPAVFSAKVARKVTLGEVKQLIAEGLKLPLSECRFWHCVSRKNGTVRPDVVHRDDENRSEMGFLVRSASEARYFVEHVNPRDPQPHPSESTLLFFKWYDPATSTITSVGSCYARPSDTLSHLEPKLHRMTSLSLNGKRPLIAFEEIRATMIELIEPDRSMKSCEIETGDIIIWQFSLSQDAQRETYRFPRASDFLLHITHRAKVEFRKLGSNVTDFELELSNLNKYEEVAQAVALHLKADAGRLRFSSHNSFSNGPKTPPISRKDCTGLKGMLTVYNRVTNILYYEVLDVPLSELEDKRSLSLRLVSHSFKEQRDLSLHVSKTGTIRDLLEEAIRVVSTTPYKPPQTSTSSSSSSSSSSSVIINATNNNSSNNVIENNKLISSNNVIENKTLGSNHNNNNHNEVDGSFFPLSPPKGGSLSLRVYEISMGRLYKVWDHAEEIAKIGDYYMSQYVVEEVLEDEAGQMRVCVGHVDSQASYAKFFGIPFVTTIGERETVSQFRERMRERLQVPAEEFSQWSLCLFASMTRREIDPNDVLSQAIATCGTSPDNVVIAFGHADRTPKTHSNFRVEKSIKIYN